jgi:hypothetical protein
MAEFWNDYEDTVREEDLQYSLDLLQRYLESMEAFLEGAEFQEARDNLRVRRQLAPDAFPQEEDWYEFVSLGYFVDVIRRSFFVTLYGFLELRLTDECHYQQQKRPDEHRTLSDAYVRGDNTMQTIRRYFVDILGMDFPAHSPEWARIQGDYRRLRNCIAHNGGQVDERVGRRNERLLREFIDTQPYLSLHTDSSMVILHREFCQEVLGTIRRFFELLF